MEFPNPSSIEMSKKTPPDIEYFYGFIDHNIKVECKSRPERFALEKWGPDFAHKHVEGVVREVKTDRKTLEPLLLCTFRL